MSQVMCTCCPMRKRKPLVVIEDGPRGVRVCPVCDGGVLDLVIKREAK